MFRRTTFVLVAASLLYCAPLFRHLDGLGREDWDQFTFRYDTPRVALLRDHVLPVWNPYANGGTVLLAHPNCPVASPFYLLVLMLGAPIGLRVQVLVFMVLGTIGMAAFVRRLGASPSGSIVSGMVFMMSSHFALHITEGHLEWCVLGLMPWLAICLMRLDDHLRYTIYSSLLLAAVTMFGAVYIPAVFLPFFSVWIAFRAARARDWAPLVRWANVVVLAGLLASVKLLPMVEFTQDWPRGPSPEAGTPPRLLLTALFNPRQAFHYQVTRDHDLPDGHFAKVVTEAEAGPVRARLAARGAVEGFQEYGCYVGIVGLILVSNGIAVTARRLWPLYGAAASALLVVLGNQLPVDFWAAMRQLPLYGQLQVPSRFLAAVVFVMAIAAGFGLDAIVRALAHRFALPGRAAAAIVILLVAAELGTLGWTLFGDIFVVPRVPLEAHKMFAQRFTRRSLQPAVMSSTMHPYLQSNSGTLDAYENLSVALGDVRVEGDSSYRGEAYLESGLAPLTIRAWTMSGLTVGLDVTRPDTLLVNQTFYRGWRARRRSSQGATDVIEARASEGGLISVPVDAEHTEIELSYIPPGSIAGAWISGTSLVLCLAGLWMRRKIPSAV